MNNYRAIASLRETSKVLEGVIFGSCDNLLDTDNLQFGFKCGIGCPDTILVYYITHVDMLIEEAPYLLLLSM